MKYLPKISALFIVLTVFSLATFAQQTEPTPKPLTAQDAVATPSALPTIYPSLRSLKPTDKFASATGRFSIALPTDDVEIETAFDKDDGETGGEIFTWSFKEGVVVVHYVDMIKYDPKTEEEYEGVALGARLGIGEDAKILSEKTITISGYRGHEIVFENSTGKNVMRAVPVRNRLYALTFVALPEVPDSDTLLLKALDSIALTKTQTKKRGPRK